MKLAVFDCDGTLIDGQAAICEAMEAAFAEAGLPLPPRKAKPAGPKPAGPKPVGAKRPAGPRGPAKGPPKRGRP